MKKIICLYGGPSSGKSTTCAGLFYKLKLAGHTAEMNREYYKDWAYEGRQARPGDQPYIFAKQARSERLYVQNGVGFIITDSPLILSTLYGRKYDEAEQLYNTTLKMLSDHATEVTRQGYRVEHYFVERVKPYSQSGRNETEEQARQLDVETVELLKEVGIKFKCVRGDETAVDEILKDLGL